MNNKQIGEKIRGIRAGKGLSQANVAHDLDITSGAYAKIERGETDANVSCLMQIAKILEVDIAEFFNSHASNNFREERNPYGFASKSEVEDIRHGLQALMREIEKLKEELLVKKSVTKKKVKK